MKEGILKNIKHENVTYKNKNKITFRLTNIVKYFFSDDEEIHCYWLEVVKKKNKIYLVLSSTTDRGKIYEFGYFEITNIIFDEIEITKSILSELKYMIVNLTSISFNDIRIDSEYRKQLEEESEIISKEVISEFKKSIKYRIKKLYTTIKKKFRRNK